MMIPISESNNLDMKIITITEDQVKKVLDNILSEDTNKISRQDFNHTQYKIEELQNSLNETLKDFRKLQDSIPDGLKTVTNNRLMTISQYLIGAQGNILKIKNSIKEYKRKIHTSKSS